MRKFIFSTCIAFVSLQSFGQAPSIQWQKSFGGRGDDEINCIKQTLDGGFIVAGYSTSNDGDVTINHGGKDYWIVKLNDTGGIQWQKSYGGSGDDIATAVQQTSDKGYIIAGQSNSLDGNVTGNHGDYDYWVLKIDDTGKVQWQKSLGGTKWEYGSGIQQTFDGGYIVTGNSYSSDGNLTVNYGFGDFWVVKLSDTGAIQWQSSYGGSNGDGAESLEQTIDSGYIIVGGSMSNDVEVSGNHGTNDYWVLKLSAAGILQWQKCLGGSGDDWAASVRQTFDSGYIVTGLGSSNDGDITGNHGGGDSWVVKLSSAGAIDWEKSLGGIGEEIGRTVLQSSDGGYVVVGESGSNDGDVSGNHGSIDSWIVKLSPAGAIQWQRPYGGSLADIGMSVQQTPGGYVFAGYSNSVDGDVTGNHGNMDYWVVKLTCGINAGPISGLSNICSGSAVTLSDTATGGVWSVSNDRASVSGGVVTAIKSGIDTVIYTITNSCGTGNAIFPITIVPCVLEENAIGNSSPLTILPNPTIGYVSITGANSATIKIYNSLGQQIKSAKNTNNISISEFPAGLYFLRLFNEQGEMIKQEKIIKE